MSVAGKQRARSFTSEEKTLLLQLANAEKAYLKGRFGPTITKKGKQGKWKHIAQELNGMNGYGDRTGDDCLKKYDNMVNEIKKQERDRMKYRKATGGGPARKTQALLEAETASCLSNLPLEQITGYITTFIILVAMMFNQSITTWRRNRMTRLQASHPAVS